MKPTFLLALFSLGMLHLAAQKIPINKNFNKKQLTVEPAAAVVLFDNTGFGGESKSLGVGQFALADFNDRASSIKVTPGYVAVLYDNADSKGGWGISVDLLEDQPDLSTFDFSDKASYIMVFPASRDNTYDWKRNSLVNGQFIAGHWERKRANGQTVGNTNNPVVSPPLPSQDANATVTALAVNGPVTTITTLGKLPYDAKQRWDLAMNKQEGIIGNDFRGSEEIGSACFERASNNFAIPDFINFWYPQKQQNDHRSVVYFKRTLAGILHEAKQFEHSGTFPDYDINLDIIPDESYKYLLRDAHPREYTGIMATEYWATRIIPFLEDQGQHDCDDLSSREEFTYLEAEIAPEYWPQGDHLFGRALFADMTLIRTGKRICVYGPWIYDVGHCCHPEIHPAEQVWWSEPVNGGVQYYCNVFCDASGRFFWRKQMDDGTKLHPWAAPPVKGLFAIAFSVPLASTTANVGYTTKKFEVGNIEDHNVIEFPNGNQVYNLVYQGRTLVSFLPHNDAFKVSYENVGFDAATNSVNGFLVIETAVGKLQQVATSLTIPSPDGGFNRVTIPPNSDPDKVDIRYENLFFKKDHGRYLFTVTQTSVNNRPDHQLTN